MSGPGLAVVVTSIQAPTACLAALAARLAPLEAPLIVIGDAAGPEPYALDGVELLTLEQQRGLDFELARTLPTGHYARKNLGYLLALARGARCLYETDDDNAPGPAWAPRARGVSARRLPPVPWTNVFAHFTDALIWPRGLPLAHARDRAGDEALPVAEVDAPVQQGLVDGSPDVDAVWRLVLSDDGDFRFDARPSVWVPPGSFCPFNSQSTWWWPEAYPLLYLPCTVSFRVTDIWRGLVAQRCLWAAGQGLVVHASEVVQDRNVHDLQRDFEQELPGYRHNHAIAARLRALELDPAPGAHGANLLRCWEALVAAGFVDPAELDHVRAWRADVARLGADG